MGEGLINLVLQEMQKKDTDELLYIIENRDNGNWDHMGIAAAIKVLIDRGVEVPGLTKKDISSGIKLIEGKAQQYCPECGKLINRNAVICPNCGVQIGKLVIEKPDIVKIKAVGVVLAIFFSFFSWLYTYKKNAGKFWLCLALNIIPIILYNTAGGPFGVLFAWLLNSLFWLWAIIYNAAKPSQFFEKYPDIG